jgi:hypothetical protein
MPADFRHLTKSCRHLARACAAPYPAALPDKAVISEFDTCFYFIVSIQPSRRRKIVVGTTFQGFQWMVSS